MTIIWAAIIWAVLLIGCSALAMALLDVEANGAMIGAAGTFLVGIVCGILIGLER